MKKTFVAALCACALVSTSFIASAEMKFPHLEISGAGEIDATPDMADINIAVSLIRPTAKEAKDASDEAISSLLERLNKMGVARQDIKSANISLRAEYNYPKNSEPKLRGYNASRNVSVTVRDLNQLNTVLDGALTDGLNKINGIDLRSSKEQELREQARSLAIENAIEKANSLAKGFNQKVTGVWKIRYNSYSPRPMMRSMALESAGNDMGYVDSTISIRDNVDVIFTLSNNEVIYRADQ